ncbi:MAG: prepilin-type N-terminal cleavage/methylation domain-containing protein [Gemmatimonadota bacterium]
MNSRPSQGGFTLVELIVAVVILAVGILGFLGTQTLLVRQGTDADLRTERAAARQSVAERLAAVPYDSILDGSSTVGRFEVTWDVEVLARAKAVRIVTVGPGFRAPAPGQAPTLVPAVADTTHLRISRP